MNQEPVYVRQHGEFASLSEDDRRAWFQQCTDAAKAEGAAWARYNVDNHQAPTRALFEAWKERPSDEGEPRWSLVPA